MQIIYRVIRDEKGEIVDLINEHETKTQEQASKWLGCDQSSVSRATIKGFLDKYISKCSPVHALNNEYLIIRG